MPAPPSDDDDVLYRAWASGDTAAGGQLVDRHLRRLARFFANKVRSAPDAEELVAETFEICARKLGDWSGAGSFRAYLLGVGHNVLRNYLRSKVRNGREIDPETDHIAALGPSPVTLVGDHREQRLLLEGLRRIPIEHQLVLELSHFEEMSRSEIAAVLGIPEGTVASRIRRAHELLATALGDLAGAPELLRSTLHGLGDWAAALRARLAAGDVHAGPRR
jgi:RNA polymerase sigma factor (sigma-70 family)